MRSGHDPTKAGKAKSLPAFFVAMFHPILRRFIERLLPESNEGGAER